MAANLRDVAERAGVSIRTVSNVVNGFAHVAPATRQRVQAVIDELGYRPNYAARHLRGGRTGLVALVVPEIASPYFGELASILVRDAEERGWTVLIEGTDGDPERERRLLGRGQVQLVDGLIFSPWALSAEELSRGAGDLPMVLLGERSNDGLTDRVAVDNVAAAREATEHLIGLGRSRIAAIGLQPQMTNQTARQRLNGYRAALRAAGIRPERGLELRVAALHRPEGYAAMGALLDGGGRPDAVFCFNDQLALGALRQLADRGLRVPDDVAVVGFDDVEDGRYAVPSLTTISPDKEEIARRALDCLVERLEGADVPARDVVAAHRLTVRESTAGRSPSPRRPRARAGAARGRSTISAPL